MEVKQILAECLCKMGESNFLQESELDDRQSEMVGNLLDCLNSAYRRVVCDHLPLVTDEQVMVSQNKVYFCDLAESILYPIRLTSGEQKQAFETFADRIQTNFDGKATLRYAYMPCCPFGINDVIEDVRLTTEIMADGTLAGYYFAHKMFDLARNFENKFDMGLSKVKYKGKNMQLPQRRWSV